MPPQEERKRKPVARKPRRVMRAADTTAGPSVRAARPDRTVGPLPSRERQAAPKRATARPKRSVRPATRRVTPPTGRGPSRRMAPTARAKPDYAKMAPTRPTHTRAAGLTKRGQRGMTGPGSLPRRVRARARAQAPAKMAPSRAPKPVTSRRPGILQTAPGRRLKPRPRPMGREQRAGLRPPVSMSGRHPGSGRTQVPPRSKRRKGKTILDRGLIRRGISRLRRQ
jgi:hypothetical protein